MPLIDIFLQYLSVDEILLLQITKYKNPALSEHDFLEILKKDHPKIYENIEKMRNDLTCELLLKLL